MRRYDHRNPRHRAEVLNAAALLVILVWALGIVVAADLVAWALRALV